MSVGNPAFLQDFRNSLWSKHNANSLIELQLNDCFKISSRVGIGAIERLVSILKQYFEQYNAPFLAGLNSLPQCLQIILSNRSLVGFLSSFVVEGKSYNLHKRCKVCLFKFNFRANVEIFIKSGEYNSNSS